MDDIQVVPLPTSLHIPPETSGSSRSQCSGLLNFTGTRYPRGDLCLFGSLTILLKDLFPLVTSDHSGICRSVSRPWGRPRISYQSTSSLHSVFMSPVVRVGRTTKHTPLLSLRHTSHPTQNTDMTFQARLLSYEVTGEGRRRSPVPRHPS